MHRWFLAFGVMSFALAAVLPSFAADEPPPIRAFDIATIEKLGRAIYEQDQLAWKATDALRAQHPDLAAEGMRGWIVEMLPDRSRVRWIRDNAGTFEAAYDIEFLGGGAPIVTTPASRTLSPEEAAQFRARQLAIQNLGQRCYENYNVIVLKDPASDGWLVWLLGASAEPDAVVLGGHVRLTISADGKTVRQRDALSRSCMVLRKQAPAGGSMAGLMASHIVSATPVETHVFATLNYGLPLFIVTPANGKMWKIEAGHISEMQK